MRLTRLTLRREALGALSAGELEAVVAGQAISQYCTQVIPTNYCTGVYPTINYDCPTIVTDKLPPTN